MTTSESLLDIQQLARKLGVTESWVRSQVLKKKIPFIKVGKLIRFSESDIVKWLEERTSEEGQ